MQALSKQFPPGLQYAIVYNATNFVTATINEIIRTLAHHPDPGVPVVYVFLQDWRATLIPTIAIPVSLIGIFAILYVLGFSANTVDLFAIVLAITLVVDDAIVVVENVTRHLEENPDRPVAEATDAAPCARSPAPVVATTLVLVAVFAPVGFISGVTGATLPPVRGHDLCRRRHFGDQRADSKPGALPADRCARRARHAFSAFAGSITASILPVREGYAVAVRFTSAAICSSPSLILAPVRRRLPAVRSTHLPAFLPSEDQGYFFINVRVAERRLARAARQQVVDQVGEMRAQDAGGSARDRVERFQPGCRHAASRTRARLSPSCSLGTSEDAAPSIPSVIASAAAGVQCNSGRGDHQFQPAGHPRHQHYRGDQLRAGGAQRTILPAARRGGAGDHLRGQSEPESQLRSSPVSRPTCRR